MPLGGLSVGELHVQAATKVVAEAEKKKRDKKEAVVMAVAKARDERRAKLRSGIDTLSPCVGHITICCNDYLFHLQTVFTVIYFILVRGCMRVDLQQSVANFTMLVNSLSSLEICKFLVTFWICVWYHYFLSRVANSHLILIL